MTLLSSKPLRALLIGTWALASTAAQATPIVFYEDFEGGSPQGTVFGQFSVNDTGINVNGTLDMGHSWNYDDSEVSGYDLPLLDLSFSTGTYLAFDYNIEIEVGYDGFNVVAADQTLAWQLLPVISGIAYAPVEALGDLGASGVQSGSAIFDLSGFDGVPGIVIRIQFASDSSVEGAGVAIDNLRVIPEPSTALLLAAGLVGLAAAGRRRRL